MLTSVILILLPITTGIYDFRTDIKTDTFTVTTPPSTTNATIQLNEEVYDDDTSTLVLTSNDTDDNPVAYSYNGTTRATVVTGLADNTTRTITAQYDYNVISGTATNTFLDNLAWIWLIMWIALPIAGIAAIWTGRA